MKCLILFILFFPFIAISQSKFDTIRQKLIENKTYEFVYRFENNYAVFSTFDHTMGVIDSLGNVIIPPLYSEVRNARARRNLYEVTLYANKNVPVVLLMSMEKSEFQLYTIMCIMLEVE